MAKQINLGKVKGDNVTVNGNSVITITGSDGITASQSGSILTLTSPSISTHVNDTTNPHQVDKDDIGLGNVDNLSESRIISDVESSIMTSQKIATALGYTPIDENNIPTGATVQEIAEEIVTSENIIEELGYTPMDSSVITTTVQNNNTTIPTGAAVQSAIDTAMANAAPAAESSFIVNSENYVQSKVIQTALAQKQGNVSGEPGQILGFDENGDLFAGDPEEDFGIEVEHPLFSDRNVYGFQLNPSESNPASMITYIGANVNYTPASMGSTTFDYGSWENAWFIHDIKVAIIDNTGNILEELDPTDYSKKTDGTASSITNPSNNGNVMVGIPQVWVKCDTSNINAPKYYFASYQVDSSYNAYAHTNEDGDVVPYIWMSAYNGYDDGTRMRSISGKTLTASQTGTVQIQKAEANNASGKHNWNISVLCDRQLITLLLMLIGRNTNSQATFGNGVTSGGQSAVIATGTMNNKGLFWGSTSATNVGVKVFGIENMWGNVYDRTHGLILSSGKMLAKLTYGTEDGSTTTGYNVTGSGYIDTGIDFSSASTTSGYIKHMKATKWGLFMDDLSGGSETTYYCDYGYIDKNNIMFGLSGGASSATSFPGRVGMYFCSLNCDEPNSGWFNGARLSMKPAAQAS